MKAHVAGSKFSLSKPFLNDVNKDVHVQVHGRPGEYIEMEDRHPLLRELSLDNVPLESSSMQD
jgi:hypothetical protein